MMQRARQIARAASAWPGLASNAVEDVCSFGNLHAARLLSAQSASSSSSSLAAGPSDQHKQPQHGALSARPTTLSFGHSSFWTWNASLTPFGTSHISAASFSTTPSNEGSQGNQSGGDSDATNAPEPLKLSLLDAVMRVAEAAVAKVEEGDMDTAISLLKEAVDEFDPKFPDSPEVGELHSQAALLLLFQNKVDEAAAHAERARDSSLRRFGERSVLTGHRRLRLGACRFAQGRLTEAAEELQQALQSLAQDPSRHEADLYLNLTLLSGANTASEARLLDDRLLGAVRAMKESFGGDSTVLSLALAQHDRVVGRALGAAQQDPALCEGLLKQHARLLEEVDPGSEDLAITSYKLATFLYAHDILPEAQTHVRKAAAILRARYNDEDDLVVMCKHRLGMICAAAGDHRSATQLLQLTRDHYLKQASTHALAKEAQLGLAMAKYRIAASADSSERRHQLQDQALAEIRSLLDELAAAVGVNHMLAQGAMRYYAQMSAMAKAKK